MNRRSRGGCISCRKAKVKCDELKPSCGTCLRRRVPCQGYQNNKSTLARHGVLVERSAHRSVSNNDVKDKGSDGPTGLDELIKRPFSRFNEPMTTAFSSQTFPKAGHPLVMDPSMMTPRAIDCLIPPGVVGQSDKATVEMYFTRHPWELSISSEFVQEMNANVLAVLQQNPSTIVDSLSAIGHSYMTESGSESSLAVLNYRARILATLRSMEVSNHRLEEMVFYYLALSAIELVDRKSTAPETMIPTIIANSSVLISHYISTGREVSSLARYFIRALARQDMIISLVHAHRPLIPTAVWLNEEARTSADRLMGYTTTLMPLLEELCILAGSMQNTLVCAHNCRPEQSKREDTGLNPHNLASPNPHYQEHNVGPEEVPYEPFDPAVVPPAFTTGNDRLADIDACVHRAEDLRRRIELWKPSIPHGMSFRKSRRFLIQANCYRAGALLYLFRLLHPPIINNNSGVVSGCSAINGEATAMAHELILFLGPPSSRGDEAKMLLWPVFIAACEMLAEEDRQMVLDVFDAILQQRKTATVQRTKSFVLNRVWPARDEGREWSWWALAQQFPGECLPI